MKRIVVLMINILFLFTFLSAKNKNNLFSVDISVAPASITSFVPINKESLIIVDNFDFNAGLSYSHLFTNNLGFTTSFGLSFLTLDVSIMKNYTKKDIAIYSYGLSDKKQPLYQYFTSFGLCKRWTDYLYTLKLGYTYSNFPTEYFLLSDDTIKNIDLHKLSISNSFEILPKVSIFAPYIEIGIPFYCSYNKNFNFSIGVSCTLGMKAYLVH